MGSYDYDLFAIGAGSGGVASSRRAGALGARVALCEVERIGGTCVLRGCVPKKLLVYASHVRDEIEDAEGFGWTIPAPTFDWPRLIAAKDRELTRLSEIYLRMLREAAVTVVEGRATIVDAHTVRIGDRHFTAKHILVATGSWPMVPEIPGRELGITSTEALSLAEQPRRLLVVGGGYIAVEIGGLFRSLGSEVTLVLRGSEVLRGFDDEVRGFLTRAMRARGIDLRSETVVTSLTRTEDGISAVLSSGETLVADAVLFATGRLPHTAGLGLAEAGVVLDPLGAVVVDSFGASSVPSIHAVGDCTNRVNLTPVAIAEARALVETLFRDNPTAMDHEDVPSAVFSQPPVGSVGLGEAEARARFGLVDVYGSSFRPMKNTLGGRDERTLVKVIVDRKTNRVIGAHMVGPDAPEIIQGIAIAVRAGATKADFDRTVGIHPTAAEEFVTLREKRPDPS